MYGFKKCQGHDMVLYGLLILDAIYICGIRTYMELSICPASAAWRIVYKAIIT